tara:strand:- start:5 stop:1063 length:1059 start_codon:yes stop_codon:yes gene_type:complete
MICVILAGGSGKRFWPLSRKDQPKQLLNIVGDQTMLQMTVDRLKKVKEVEDIYIITRSDLKEKIIKNVQSIESDNVITEPSGKNTAPAIALISTIIDLKNPNSTIGVFPADHLIIGHLEFQKAILTGKKLAKEKNAIVTIGVKPTFASTGYGYVQFEEMSKNNFEGVFKVKAFAEKPHKKLAERFIKSGDFLWNAGMFIWETKTLFEGLKVHMPELYDSMAIISDRIKEGKNYDDIWTHIDSESIDYGLLEKVNNIYVISCEFQWNDLGSWNSLYKILAKDKKGNVTRGLGKILDGENNFIHSENIFTAVVGVSDMVVICTDEVNLVVPRDKVELVKEMVNYLEESGLNNLV